MQDEEKETPKQGHNAKTQKRSKGQFAPSVSKSTLIQALDEYIMGAPSGELCEKYGIPRSTFRNFRVRAGVEASGRLLRTDRVEEWRKVYEKYGTVTAVKQHCGGELATISRELGVDRPLPKIKSKKGPRLGMYPKRVTEAMRHRIRHLRSEVLSEVVWWARNHSRYDWRTLRDKLAELDREKSDEWWWQRLDWTIGEWAEYVIGHRA